MGPPPYTGSGDGSDDSGGGISGWGDLALPDWLKSFKALTGVSVLGYDLVTEPQGFILALLLDTAVGWAEEFAGRIALLIIDLAGLLAGIVVDTGAAAVAPLGAAGDAVLFLVFAIRGIIVSLALLTGPFAPFVAAGLWAVTFVGLAWAVPWAARLGFRVLTWVIPWL